MNKKINLKNVSRTEFILEVKEGKTFTSEQIKLSVLLRIADAVENMSKSYIDMQADLDFFKKKNDQLLAQEGQSKRTISNLKSQLTKKEKNGSI